MRKINILCLLLLGSSMSFAQSNTHTEQSDTLQREMILEREYIPDTEQATKEFFNPLDTKRDTRLKSLNFANTTYGVRMEVRPRLFDPVYRSYASLPKQHTWHARIFGGYPTRFGLNTGLLFRAGENGIVDLAIDHCSLKDLVPGDSKSFRALNNTHDTNVVLRYGHKLPDRLLNVSAKAYNNMQTYFGHAVMSTTPPDGAQPRYPLYQMVGGAIDFNLSPAPLILRSPWQYSLYGTLGYGRQSLPIPASATDKNNANGLDLLIGGKLAYGIFTYDFNFGADLFFKTTKVSAKRLPTLETSTPMVFSVSPYVSYVYQDLSLRGGANIQFLNGVSTKLHISPNITAKWKATDDLSAFATVKGGGEVTGFRELYRLNRYSLPTSLSKAMTLADYDATIGVQVGSISGLSLDLRGGYASYRDYYDWAYDSATPDPKDQAHGLPFTTFLPQRKNNVGLAYLTASARYIYAGGLEIVGSMQYNNYILAKNKVHLSGRPAILMNLSVDYQILPSLTAHCNLQGVGGIKYLRSVGQKEYGRIPFVADLSARISYKLHKNLGLSLMGTNLINQRESRWIDYSRPGIGVLGAVTINL